MTHRESTQRAPIRGDGLFVGRAGTFFQDILRESLARDGYCNELMSTHYAAQPEPMEELLHPTLRMGMNYIGWNDHINGPEWGSVPEEWCV